MRNIKGQRFGRLIVIEKHGVNDWGNITWLCKCDCGNEHIAASGKLIQGKVTSCGCYKKELGIKQLEKHGITTGGKPRTFIIWNGIKARCFNPKSISYKNYGGRGISICEEWLEFENFHNWALSNGYKDGLQIDRVDNDGNYEPQNCRWVTKSENLKKQRRIKYITINGVSETITGWSKKLKISRNKITRLLNSNYQELEKIVSKFLKEDKANECKARTS